MDKGLLIQSSYPPGRLDDSAVRNQRGVTGLETAIVLIAFVVVASVFAFAVLSTGMVSSERSKRTIIGSLQETSSSLLLRGSVIAIRGATSSTVASVRFHATTASKAGESISLITSGPNAAIVTYIDAQNTFNSTDWTAVWLTGAGPLLDTGETVEIDVPLGSLSSPLGPAQRFTIELKPSVGPVLTVARTTPDELTPVNNLN